MPYLPTGWRVRIPVQLSRENIVLLVVAVALVWMSWSLVQELGLNHQLSAQKAQLAQQNAQIAAQNRYARQDVRNVSSGGWDEEQARTDGYARPGERVLIVSTPAAPQAVAPPPRKQAQNPFQGFWDWLTGSSPS
ncbi:MAG: septum formation initiator family protein [Candidatus Dormiibacterota bacterium]